MFATPALQGLLLSAGLIIAIGPQNLFVLKQGLKRKHAFTVALLSALGDATLIAIGCFGGGELIANSPTFSMIGKWGGVLFLTGFAFRCFRSVFQKKSKALEMAATEAREAQTGRGLGAIVFTSLALSFLNPHAILDTVVMIGTLASRYDAKSRIAFGAGAASASFLWFFSVAYGARYLSKIFQKEKAWKIFDAAVGLLMLTFAASLALS